MYTRVRLTGSVARRLTLRSRRNPLLWVIDPALGVYSCGVSYPRGEGSGQYNRDATPARVWTHGGKRKNKG